MEAALTALGREALAVALLAGHLVLGLGQIVLAQASTGAYALGLQHGQVALAGVLVVRGRMVPRSFGLYGPYRFENVAEQAGVADDSWGCGMCAGDYDNDGRVDAVVTALDAPVQIWRNLSPPPNHWLAIQTVGTRSNRDGIGAKIKLFSPSGVRYDHVNTAVGYGGASDKRVHFGLGKDEVVTRLEITWPSGIVQALEGVKADQVLVVTEPET